jgi:cytochrome c biogenesis protein CcmG, thiol:disulfide interchange protein DsbE
MKKTLFILLSVVALASLALFMNPAQNIVTTEKNTSAIGGKGAEEQPRVGYQAPSFQLRGLDGKTHSLADAARKPVVINFWASWCGPCKMEAPELTKLAKEYDGKIIIYAINVTDSDSEKAAKDFANHYQFKFPVLLDGDGSVGARYQVQAIPTSFFISKEGTIIDQVIGFADAKTFTEKFEKLIR